jgi:hypothetical protein
MLYLSTKTVAKEMTPKTLWASLLVFIFLSTLASSLLPVTAEAAVGITNIAVTGVTQNSATISWQSSVPGHSWVGYTPDGGTQKSVTDLKQVTSHSMTLSNLLAGTRYTFEVNSQTLTGDIGYVAGQTFTTTTGLGGDSTYPCGQLAKSGQGIYFLTGKDKVKIPFTSMAAFTGLGYNLKNVKTLDLGGYKSSGSYYLSSPTQEHPWCSWMKWKDGTIYYSHPSGAIPVPSWDVFLSNGGRADLIVPMNAADDAIWAKNPNLSPLQINDARIL